jgi:[ribosomal protein S5]-alanine N-acetyltransferase
MHHLKRSDYEDVEQLYRNHKVRKYLGGVREEASIGAVLDYMLNATKESYYWVVREKNTAEFIGLISIDQHHNGIDLEVSYQLLPKWWGAGFATEVVQHIVNYALNELKLSRVIAETQSANTSSCRLLERIGMQLEKKIYRFGAEQAIYSIQLSENEKGEKGE